MSIEQTVIHMLTYPVIKNYVTSHAWVWPVCEMIHYVGMSLIIGLIGVLDLRILGLFKGLPIGAVRPFVPLAVIGFIANIVTGLVFMTGTPSDPVFYVNNLSFQLKMATLVIAGLNLAIFRLTGLERGVYGISANASAPAAAKAIAVISLICWMFVIFFGRLLMYNDTLLGFLGI